MCRLYTGPLINVTLNVIKNRIKTTLVPVIIPGTAGPAPLSRFHDEGSCKPEGQRGGRESVTDWAGLVYGCEGLV